MQDQASHNFSVSVGGSVTNWVLGLGQPVFLVGVAAEKLPRLQQMALDTHRQH